MRRIPLLVAGLALVAALLCCSLASAQYVVQPQMRMQMMPQMQMIDTQMAESPFGIMAADDIRQAQVVTQPIDVNDSARQQRLADMAHRFQIVTSRINNNQADATDLSELTSLQQELATEYAHATPAEQARYAGVVQQINHVIAQMKQGLALRLRATPVGQPIHTADMEVNAVSPADFTELFETSRRTDIDIDTASTEDILERMAVEAEGFLQTTENPRIVRLRDLFNRGGRAMKAVQEGRAGRRELSELKAVRLGLSQEFQSYPTELQREIRPAYQRVQAALGRVIVQLQNKIERGTAEGEEGELEASLVLSPELNVSDDLHLMMARVVAAELGIDHVDRDMDGAMGVDRRRSAAGLRRPTTSVNAMASRARIVDDALDDGFDVQQWGRWGRGWGRGFGGWGRGFGGWGRGFGFGRPWGWGGFGGFGGFGFRPWFPWFFGFPGLFW